MKKLGGGGGRGKGGWGQLVEWMDGLAQHPFAYQFRGGGGGK